jgi:hypothetical protein
MPQTLMLFFAAVLFSSSVSAQIYSGQNFPQAGDVYYMYSDTTPYAMNGSLLTGLAPWYLVSYGYDYIDDIEIVQPGLLPFNSSFPLATLGVIDSSNRDFFSGFFLQQTGDDYEMLGGLVQAPSGLQIPMVFNEPLTWLSLPLSLGNSLRDTAFGTISGTGTEVGFPVDSIMLQRTIYRFDTVDMSGELTIPGLILENAIRRVVRDSIVDSVFIQVNGIWTYQPDGESDAANVFAFFEWYHPDKDWMVAQALIRNDPNYGEQIRLWRYLIAPPPSTRVQFEGLPSDISILDTVDFSVSVRSVATGQLISNFMDSVRIGVFPDTSWGWGYWQVDEQAVLPQAGVANFENLWFFQPGQYQLLAWSDTTLSDTSIVINVHPVATHIVLDQHNVSVAENQQIPPIEAAVVNDSGGVDAFFYSGIIRVGKLTGPGEIVGTKDVTISSGVASFNDLRLSKAGTYQLAFYVPLGQNYLVQDTLTVTVAPNGPWTYSDTDTLEEYVARAHEFVWFGNLDGYLSGTSRGGFSEVAQQFDFVGTARLTQVLIYFANRFHVGDDSDIYTVKVYDAGLNSTPYFPDGPERFLDSLPLTLLGSQNFLADSIELGDYWIRRFTTITFDDPPTVNSNFIVSVQTDSELSNDTIIIWHSIIGDGQQEYRTSKLMNGWGSPQNGDTLWVRDKYWRPSFDVDLMISPVLEIDTVQILVSTPNALQVTATISPNPTTGQIQIRFEKSFSGLLELYDGLGRPVLSKQAINDLSIMMDLSKLANGQYNLRLRDSLGKLIHSEKVVLSKN